MGRNLQQHKLILFLLVIAGLALDCFAQPGDERPQYRQLALNLIHQITAVTGEIAKRPNDIELREKRADLYTKLYTMTGEGSYVHLKDVAPDLTEIEIVNAVIGDYSRIISSHRRKPEHFLKRGEAYAVRWNITKVNWDSAMLKHHPFWGDRTDWGDVERTTQVFRAFIKNRDFDLAMADLQKAAKDHTTDAEEKMGLLYSARLGSIPLWYSDAVRRAAEAGIAGFSIWRDYDRAIEHFSRAVNSISDEIRPTKSMFWHRYSERPSPQDAIFGKLQVAVRYGRDKDIAAIFDHYLSWINFNYENADRVCQYYSEGLRAHVRLGNYDRVLATVGNVLYEGAPTRCEAVIEPRGDAYLGKGEYALTLADYNDALDHKEYQSFDREIHIKRAKAYIGLGEKEKAVADLNWALPKGYSGYRFIEAHLLRASLLREMGKNKEAADDEGLAKYMQLSKLQRAEHDREYKKRKGVIFGIVILPSGQPLYDSGGYAVVKYSDGSQDSWWPVDEQGRFELRLKPLPFTIHVVRAENGIDVDYTAQPRAFPAITTRRGPIVITLSRSSGN